MGLTPGTGVSFRWPSRRDVEAIEQLQRDDGVAEAKLVTAANLQRTMRANSSPGAHTVATRVAVHAGQVIGAVVYFTQPGDNPDCVLLWVYVAAGSRRCGVGRRLVQHVAARVCQRVTAIVSERLHDAVQFFAACGFRATLVRSHDGGDDTCRFEHVSTDAQVFLQQDDAATYLMKYEQ